ncbi:hypothetical protein, partial [Capnocytophaga canis]|uniref:hypothetical protein n=1 Tax=Capnocytophaga canis TaxID=1848903 RepID=UPI001E55F5B0
SLFPLPINVRNISIFYQLKKHHFLPHCQNYERVYLVTGANKLHQELSSKYKIEDYRENFIKKVRVLKK